MFCLRFFIPPHTCPTSVGPILGHSVNLCSLHYIWSHLSHYICLSLLIFFLDFARDDICELYYRIMINIGSSADSVKLAFLIFCWHDWIDRKRPRTPDWPDSNGPPQMVVHFNFPWFIVIVFQSDWPLITLPGTVCTLIRLGLWVRDSLRARLHPKIHAPLRTITLNLHSINCCDVTSLLANCGFGQVALCILMFDVLDLLFWIKYYL